MPLLLCSQRRKMSNLELSRGNWMERRRIWDLEPKSKLVLGLLVAISLAMFIAGAIMLAIGIHKANICGNCMKPGPIPSSSLPTAIFSSSYTQEFQWSNDLLNPSSKIFLDTTEKIIKNIKEAFHPNRRKRYMTQLAVQEPLNIAVTKFMQAPNGVDFYSTIIFPNNATTSKDVEKNLDGIGFSTDASADPTSNCLTLKPPHGAPTTTTISSTSTMISTSTTKRLPDGVFCDVSDSHLLNVFLIDVAVPTIGTLEDKLSNIRSYLSSADFTVNLSKTGNWGKVAFHLVTYSGEITQPLTNFCHSDAEWQKAVKLLNPSINPAGNNFHRLNTGLQYVENNLVKQPVGEGRNLIIITDGIDITDKESYNTALRLRNNFKYTVSAVVVSTSQIVRDNVKRCVSDSSHFVQLQSFSWLSNKGVTENAANWICNAFYPTPPPTTPSPTPITLEYTTVTNLPTPTIKPTTKPIGPVPVPVCTVDVLFLIDESQTMLLQGYTQSLSFVYAISEKLNQQNKNSQFAIITYNSAIVFNSMKYKSYGDFIVDMKKMPMKEGTADMLLGFTTAKSLIASGRYAQKGVRSVLYFLSDGFTNKKTDISLVSAITNDLQSTYQTEIIAIGLDETHEDEEATKQAIGWDLMNGYVQSKYIGVSDPDEINSTDILNTITSAISCKSDHQLCEVDLTFVIEVSLAEQLQNIEVEKRVVNGLIRHYSRRISMTKGKVSLVYFSAPDGLQSAEYNKTAILYNQAADAENAIKDLESADFTPLGGASDIKLAMDLTLQVLSNDVTGNSKYVIFFARGSFYEAPNCCDDPSATAKMVREYPNTKMQGVLLGEFPNKKNLDQYTGSNSVNANALLVKNQLGEINITASAFAIQHALIPLIDNQYLNPKCSPIDPTPVPCVEFVDINIILHASSEENWNIIKTFITKEVIPNLLGAARMSSILPLTQGDAVNFAIIAYGGTSVKNLATFTHLLSPSAYVDLITNAKWENTKDTPQLHLAYQMAITNMKDGRKLASKTLLVITDELSRSDLKAALVKRQAMPLSYLYGITIKNIITPDNVPGENDGVILNYIQLLSEKSPYSARAYANKATAGICRFVQVPTTSVVSVPPTSAPCISPPEITRELWPDITILIDTSTGTDAMDPQKFEYMRAFLKTTFLNKYAIGTQKSRFSIGTFNNDVNFACLFSDITNYCDLRDCLNGKLSYNPVSNQLNRDINSALQSTMLKVYDPSARNKSDYRPLKENFLYLFTLGKSTTKFSASLSSLKQLGIRTVGISLDSDMSINDLSQFGPNSYNVIKWTDSQTGINSKPQLADVIFETTTRKQLPALVNFFADFYIIIDQSASIQPNNADVVQFVHDFVKQLTLDVHKSRISVIPYSSTVDNVLSLTDNQKSFDSWFKQWIEQAPSVEKSSNIGEAIDNVVSQLPNAANKATYVIYIVGAATSTGIEKTAQIAIKKWVVPIVLQLNNEVTYTTKLAEKNNIYKLSNGAGLRNWVDTIPEKNPNQMNKFFNDLFSDQEKYDSKNFPLDEVIADVLIMFDETGLTFDQFENVKKFISDLTDRFNIGNRYTQFALQAYNGDVIPEAGFHFHQSFNSTTVKKLISDLRIKKMPDTASAALPGALEQCLLFILNSNNGWREDSTTYTIILSNAKHINNDADKVQAARKIMSISKVFAIGMNNHVEPLVKSFVNSEFYGTVKSPNELKISAKTSVALLNAIDADYKNQVYPDKTSLATVEADYIILIDNNRHAFTWNNIKNFLKSVKSSIYKIGYGQSRLSIINFNSKGVREDYSWNLNTNQDISDIIDHIDIVGDNEMSDLNKAITYILQNPIQFGFRSNRLVFATLISSSSHISSPIPESVTVELNSRCQTFAIQTDSRDQHEYVKQFLGKNGYHHYLYNDNVYDFTSPIFDSYRKFIRQRYFTWLHTNQ